MVEVTSEISEKFVRALLNINKTNRKLKQKLKWNVIEVNLQIHNEQIDYKLQEGQIEADNAKLSLLNQQLVVYAMVSLTASIGRFARWPNDTTQPTTPDVGTSNTNTEGVDFSSPHN